VYLYNPALKSGLTRKFAKPWIGPCQIIRKISELNYEIMDSKGKRQVVHVNRLKKSFNPEFWNPKLRQKSERNAPRKVAKSQRANGNLQDDVKIGPYPLVCPQNSEARTEHKPLGEHSPDTPDLFRQPTHTPISDRNDPNYQPPDTPTSKRKLQTSRAHPRSIGCLRKPYLRMLRNSNMSAKSMRICMLQGACYLSRYQRYIFSHLITVVFVTVKDVILSNEHWRVAVNVNLSTYHEVLSTVKSDLLAIEKQRKEFTLTSEL
jgi:hypothetical protein